MTNEEAKSELMQIYMSLSEEKKKALDVAFKAMEQEPCNELPTVAIPNKTEPKTGHWEWVQYDSNPNIGNWHCSECRTIIPHMPVETDNTPIYKWCPMCGARMVEPQESEG